MDLYSSMRLVSDGTLQTVLLSFEYTSRNEVHVYIDGLEKTTGWSWADSTGKTIRFDEPVPADSVVLFRRLTKLNEVPYIFGEAAGSRGYSEFSAYTVDFNFDFVLRASQDALDSFTLSGATAEAAEMWAKRSEQSALRSDANANAAAANAARADQRALEAGSSATASANSASASAASATEAKGYRDTAGTHASTAGTRAGEASASAAAADTSATNSANSAAASQTSRLASESARNQAQASATAAGNSASAALSSQNAAAGSATAANSSAAASQTARVGAETARAGAQTSETKAKEWADNDRNVPVEPGKFSAKHWAQVAQDIGDLNLYLKKTEVGTAAYANLTQNDQDARPGRVLQTGDLGSGSHYVVNMDFNDLPETFPYSGNLPVLIHEDSPNQPPNPGFYHVQQFLVGGSGGNITQLVIPHYQGVGYIHYRTRYDNVWSRWVRVWDNDNIAPITSSTDLIPGRLLTNNQGWMGLGGMGIDLAGKTDAQTEWRQSYFFRRGASGGDSPYPTDVSGIMMAYMSSGTQFAASIAGTRAFLYSNGGPLVEFLTTHNILPGTGASTTLPMSQKAVTDELDKKVEVIASGTNAVGSWVKLSDGTMYTFNTRSIVLAGVVWAVGDGISFLAMSGVSEFPAEFLPETTPEVIATLTDNDVSTRSAYLSAYTVLNTGLTGIYTTSPKTGVGDSGAVRLRVWARGVWR